jgi:uncharacterized protein (TIGR00266 family)
MHFELLYKPTHSLAIAQLQANEGVRAESSAMIGMTSNIQVATTAGSARSGGFLKSLKRGVLGGESFFTNHFTAVGGPGQVTLAPQLCGDMIVHTVSPNEDLLIQGQSYVAAPDSVQIDTQFQGFKGLFSGESLFFLKATGSGPVLINAFGAIESLDLDGEMVVDTGHLVAFSSFIRYEVSTAAPSWITSFLSGEGLVLKMQGRGRVYVQSRNPSEYGTTVAAELPPRQG